MRFLVLGFVAVAAGVAAADVIELEGSIKSIDVDARAVVIVRQTPKGEKVLELEIAKNAGDVTGLKAGDRVNFAYNPDVEIVTKIEKGVSAAVAADLKAFQGEWKNTLTEEAGNRLEPAEQRRENRTLFIKGDTFRMERVKNGTFGAHEGTFRLDPERHFFDMQEPGGLTYVGIYDLKGDVLKLCYRLYSRGNPPPPRPTEFKTSADKPPVFNYEYKKVSAEAALPAGPAPLVLTKGAMEDNWQPREPVKEGSWDLQDEVLTCRADGTSLVSKRQFADFELQMDFRLPPRCNSGIYLRGCYELQLLDSTWRSQAGEPAKPFQRTGAIYGQIPPAADAYRGPNVWNTLAVRLQGNVLTVHLNGEKIIDAQALQKPTPGGPCGDTAVGPIMIQAQSEMNGAQFRNIVVTPFGPR